MHGANWQAWGPQLQGNSADPARFAGNPAYYSGSGGYAHHYQEWGPLHVMHAPAAVFEQQALHQQQPRIPVNSNNFLGAGQVLSTGAGRTAQSCANASQVSLAFNPTYPIHAFAQQARHKDEEDAQAQSSRYVSIQVHKGWLMQGWNDLRNCRLHYLRSRRIDELLINIASPAEQQHIHAEMHVHVPALINMLVWRRSLLKVVAVLITCFVVFHFWDAWAAMRRAFVKGNQDALPIDFEVWKIKIAAPTGRKQDFFEFTFDVLKEVQRLATIQASYASAFLGMVVAAVNLCALALVLVAQSNWNRGRRTRRLTIRAWILYSAAPILASFAPAQFFVDWTPAERVLHGYQAQLEQRTGFDDKVKKMREKCKTARSDEGVVKLQKAKQRVEQICGFVGWLPRTQMTVPFSNWNVFKWKKVDVRPVHRSCSEARSQIASGNPEKALESLRKACDRADRAFDLYEEHPDMVGYAVMRGQAVLEAITNFSFGLGQLLMILPAALSIAPGMMQGAILMKMLVPQSTIPGILILLLPWLYCPLVWCICYLIFQATGIVGDGFLLCGMLLIAFNPLAYVVLGKAHHIDKSMTDAQVELATKRIQGFMSFLSFLGFASICVFVVKLVHKYSLSHNLPFLPEETSKNTEWWADKEQTLLEEILALSLTSAWNRIDVKLVASASLAAGRYYLSSIAALDIMVGNMVEHYMEQKVMSQAIAEAEDRRCGYRREGNSNGDGGKEKLAVELSSRMDGLMAAEDGIAKKK